MLKKIVKNDRIPFLSIRSIILKTSPRQASVGNYFDFDVTKIKSKLAIDHQFTYDTLQI